VGDKLTLWSRIAIGAAVPVTVIVLVGFQAVGAAPEPRLDPDAAAPRPVQKTFAAICKALALPDSRPDPAWLGASFEGDACRAPRLPAALDGFTATREQIVAGMAAAKRYAAEVDTFQRCVGDFLAAGKARADRQGKPIRVALAAIESHRIAVSEKDKQLAQARIDVAINAFNEYGSDCPDH
jgi:hypothetical protein